MQPVVSDGLREHARGRVAGEHRDRAAGERRHVDGPHRRGLIVMLSGPRSARAGGAVWRRGIGDAADSAAQLLQRTGRGVAGETEHGVAPHRRRVDVPAVRADHDGIDNGEADAGGTALDASGGDAAGSPWPLRERAGGSVAGEDRDRVALGGRGVHVSPVRTDRESVGAEDRRRALQGSDRRASPPGPGRQAATRARQLGQGAQSRDRLAVDRPARRPEGCGRQGQDDDRRQRTERP